MLSTSLIPFSLTCMSFNFQSICLPIEKQYSEMKGNITPPGHRWLHCLNVSEGLSVFTLTHKGFNNLCMLP